MATASRTVRKNRRIKRNASLAFRGIRMAVDEISKARFTAAALEKELQKRENAIISKESLRKFFAEHGLEEDKADALYEYITVPPEEPTKNKVTITRIDEPEV